MNFAALSTALSRSIGIPSRMVTAGHTQWGTWKPDPITYQPSGTLWRYHVWTETWLENLPIGDIWYVFDSTDYVSTEYGISLSRLDYGKIWVHPSQTDIVIFGESEDAPPIDITDDYK